MNRARSAAEKGGGPDPDLADSGGSACQGRAVPQADGPSAHACAHTIGPPVSEVDWGAVSGCLCRLRRDLFHRIG